MQQLTCTAPGVVEWCEVPEPALQAATDVLVRPLAVARCDIDPTLIATGPTRGDRFALGHEAVVEVIATGADVSSVQEGQLALPSFWISCGSCDQCRTAKPALCGTYPLLSSFGMEPLSGIEYGGMLSDIVRVPDADYMLARLPENVDPVAVASVPDNVVDGYRLVAQHLARRPASRVLVSAHGSGSIGLYAAMAALALGSSDVTVATNDSRVSTIAHEVGANVVAVDFNDRPPDRWPIVIDVGVDLTGLQWSIRATEPEGVLQSMGSIETAAPINLMRLYTLGIELHFGRAHSAAVMPEVLALVAEGRLQPQLVTTDVVEWKDAASRYADPAIKLIVQRL